MENHTRYIACWLPQMNSDEKIVFSFKQDATNDYDKYHVCDSLKYFIKPIQVQAFRGRNSGSPVVRGLPETWLDYQR